MTGKVIRGVINLMVFFLALLAIITLWVGASVTQTQNTEPLYFTHCCFKQQLQKDQTYWFTPMI
jgi:hypothetical protein